MTGREKGFGGVPTMGLTHIALAVEDLRRAVKFYRTLLGARITYEDGDHVELQTPGAKDFIALEKADGKRVGHPGGVAHFGFRLQDPKDIDAAIRAVEAGGGKVRERGEFSPGHPYAFVKDPDGYEVEIWYE